MVHQSTDILIIGSGFGGLSLFRNIDRDKHRVLLLSNRNHFLFNPLLPLAASGRIEVRSIVEPLRTFQKNEGEVLIGEAIDIDPDEKKVFVMFDTEKRATLSFEILIVAIGAQSATYRIPGVVEYCLFFKEMKDARKLREKILFQFENAEHLEGESQKRALRFVLVGAGPTGVELACEIHDLIYEDLVKEFPLLIPYTEILIIDAGKEILSSFDQTLVQYAKSKLEQKKIRVRTQTHVKAVDKNHLTLQTGEYVESETIIWTAGIGPRLFTQKLAERLHRSLDKAGRIPVTNLLNIGPDYPDIYIIGDCAGVYNEKGQGHTLPATAQVAMKEGLHLAKNLNQGKQRPFHYHSMGMLASLGTGSAIANIGAFRFKGALAWWFWKAAYLTKLVSWRNKITVAFDWIKVRFFGRNTARIEF
jgi:NADH:ubiquinone reductase (non-electrogenic)